MNGVFIEESRFSVLGWRQQRIRGFGEEGSTGCGERSENAAAPVGMTG
jgi:hypothetical protein